MHKLAFSTNAFKRNTLHEAVDVIASIGYAGVEVMADVPHALPTRFSRTERDELIKRIRGNGLTPSNLNAFTLFACGDTYHPTWIEDDANLRQQRIDHTLAAIELAHDLSIRTVSLQPGGPLIGRRLSAEAASSLFADGLRKCIDRARDAGVALAIEPEPGLLIESAAEYIAFKDQYFKNELTIRMNCDIGHLFCVGEDPASVIRSMPDQIAHVHLEDIGANRVHQHLTPGKGAIDFTTIFAALDAVQYDGWVTVELYPYETTAAGVARLAFDYLGSMVHL